MNNINIILLTLIESIYVYYMYNIFKTKISFHHPLEILIQNREFSDYLSHPISSGIYESKICKLGNDVSLLIICWLWIRLLFKKDKIIKYNYILFILILICSLLMNINSFIYFIPIYIYELIIYPKLKIDCFNCKWK